MTIPARQAHPVSRSNSAARPWVSRGVSIACTAALAACASHTGERSSAEQASDGREAAIATAPAPAVTRTVETGGYAGEGGYFDIARDVLRDEGFILERVDAQLGVILTRPKTTAGLATPWHTDQSTIEQEIDDLANRQQRTVRITFAAAGSDPSGSTSPAPDAPPTDLRAAQTPIDMSVRVIVERLQRPGRRISSASVRLSTYSIDTDFKDRGLAYGYAVPIEDDQNLAARLADEIAVRHDRAVRSKGAALAPQVQEQPAQARPDEPASR